ncbi:MAG: discoidin domain-containing protein [Fervidobacterium sp.]|nr:discoidin domain-containing protein [Fervidobacterium sp.]
MKKFSIFMILFTILAFSQDNFKIPESSYWYPNDLLEWSPETDPEAIYNVSSIPLNNRIKGGKISKNASEKVKIVALSVMNPSTSGMPSQGRNDSMRIYTFTYWQYIDFLVAWAGSAGEGIIVPPSADVIDAAHKNGVPVLGTIFFPPNVYGGRRNWVDQLLQETNGQFPIADKLISVARYYGFDGWFINQETEGCDQEHVKQLTRFIGYFKSKAPDLTLFWYDAMNNYGEIMWQGELNETNVVFLTDLEEQRRLSDYLFIDFRWISSKRPNSVENSLKNAQKYKISQYDLFAGVLLQGEGYNTPYFNLSKIQDQQGTLKLSLGLFGPCWSYYSSKKIDEFWKKEDILWVGNHDLLDYKYKSEASRWPGFAQFVVEKSPITSLPFVTHFNVGHGKYFFVNGKKLGNSEWYNRSLQDILPTYRWLVKGKKLDVEIDYENAYYGGTSLKFCGSMLKGEFSEYILYLTDIEILPNTVFSFASKNNEGKVLGTINLYFSDGEILKLPFSSLNDWKEYSYYLTSFIGRKIKNIGITLRSNLNQNVSFNLGKIAIYQISSKTQQQTSKIVVDEIKFEEGIFAQIKIHWNRVEGAKHYEVYRILPNNLEEFVWASTNNYTYICKLKRIGKEKDTKLKIVAIFQDMSRSKPLYTKIYWPPYPKPRAEFTVSNTIISPGESVVFESLSSETTEELEWLFVGGEPLNSNLGKVIVKYEKEGLYPVKLVARNTSGEDIRYYESMIAVTQNAKNLKNLALGKMTYASSFVPHEKPSLAVDGAVEGNSKWCAVGDLPHWLVVDLEKECLINKVVIRHAQEGKESEDWNTKAYRIQISSDGENWNDIIVVKSNSKGLTEHSFPPVKTRYVRLLIEIPTQTGDKAARIYEFEIFGLSDF